MKQKTNVRTSQKFGNVVCEKTLDMAQQMVKAMLDDRVIRRIMSRADKISQDAGQVAHGFPHCVDVRELTEYVLREVECLRPGTVSLRDVLVGIASAILHDSGRAIDVAQHDKFSAIIAHRYLRSLALRLFGSRDLCPEWFRAGVVSGVRKHRSESILYKNEAEKVRRKKEVTDVALAALLIADKLCGSEVRVRHDKSEFLDSLKELTLSATMRARYGLDESWSFARVNWHNEDSRTEHANVRRAVKRRLNKLEIACTLEIDNHDRVNKSITNRVIEFFLDQEDGTHANFKGTMRYRLTVDERVAPMSLVTGLDWWHDAFHTAAKAAKALGFRFQLDFNGKTLFFDKKEGRWVNVEAKHA